MPEIQKEDICNLARIPVAMQSNPCYITVKQLLDRDLHYTDTALYHHYKTFNPVTLLDLWGKGPEMLKKYRYSYIYLPWLHRCPMLMGNPLACIEVKAAVQAGVMPTTYLISLPGHKGLIRSIGEKGYVPSEFSDRRGGHISGYFLKEGNKRKFYVVAGNHRASILSAMFPDDPIPVVYEERKFLKPHDLIPWDNHTDQMWKMLDEYSIADAHQWPSTKENDSSFIISVEDAKNIARTYLESK